ncbi:hypothetical protein Tb927.5.4010 [Trypanosoma brucei brucei TREU927]|uniref:Uncharacterized protein n=1 Tax=Trypanosoma brucei brucei (strain 927/4 GUTat10.1) TaxID=185431 RepID=Q57Z48_TRYB2|nr:hypothetical protein Tb927.5.4010 [Trypanosoma brucei brucei TREU927]AAX80601.1 hypothetical protein Tb927.5.4010 [Trypanosoma brucei]AAZ11512.1 hypothetical protein Tb927.5.4010 [Trypanosoma brucei brucei TREU927]
MRIFVVFLVLAGAFAIQAKTWNAKFPGKGRPPAQTEEEHQKEHCEFLEEVMENYVDGSDDPDGFCDRMPGPDVSNFTCKCRIDGQEKEVLPLCRYLKNCTISVNQTNYTCDVEDSDRVKCVQQIRTQPPQVGKAEGEASPTQNNEEIKAAPEEKPKTDREEESVVHGNDNVTDQKKGDDRSNENAEAIPRNEDNKKVADNGGNGVNDKHNETTTEGDDTRNKLQLPHRNQSLPQAQEKKNNTNHSTSQNDKQNETTEPPPENSATPEAHGVDRPTQDGGIKSPLPLLIIKIYFTAVSFLLLSIF